MDGQGDGWPRGWVARAGGGGGHGQPTLAEVHVDLQRGVRKRWVMLKKLLYLPALLVPGPRQCTRRQGPVSGGTTTACPRWGLPAGLQRMGEACPPGHQRAAHLWVTQQGDGAGRHDAGQGRPDGCNHGAAAARWAPGGIAKGGGRRLLARQSDEPECAGHGERQSPLHVSSARNPCLVP